MRLRFVLALAAGCIGLAVPALAVLPPTGTYTYRINHPDHGEIGTYTNRITRNGDTVAVDTEVRIAVKLAFVTAYRLEEDRREEWRDGRLVSYSAEREKNGKKTRIEGHADGDKFVIQGPKGSFTAPAGVWPANPWSPEIAEATAVMGTSSGRLYDPQVTGGGEETIEVGGRSIQARHYAVMLNEPHHLWFDPAGRLVKFTTVEDGDTVTLTLK